MSKVIPLLLDWQHGDPMKRWKIRSYNDMDACVIEVENIENRKTMSWTVTRECVESQSVQSDVLEATAKWLTGVVDEVDDGSPPA